MTIETVALLPHYQWAGRAWIGPPVQIKPRTAYLFGGNGYRSGESHPMVIDGRLQLSYYGPMDEYGIDMGKTKTG